METVIDKIKRFKESAPVNVEALIRSFGIELDVKASLNEEVSGELVNLGKERYRISINKNDPYYRKRFTMAHELGHFLLHRGLIGDGVNDSRAYRSVKNGKFYNLNITAAHEAQANRFAANLLMPEDLVRDEYEKAQGDIVSLSKKFQVSKAAMTYVLNNLGLEPPDHHLNSGIRAT